MFLLSAITRYFGSSRTFSASSLNQQFPQRALVSFSIEESYLEAKIQNMDVLLVCFCGLCQEICYISISLHTNSQLYKYTHLHVYIFYIYKHIKNLEFTLTSHISGQCIHSNLFLFCIYQYLSDGRKPDSLIFGMLNSILLFVSKLSTLLRNHLLSHPHDQPRTLWDASYPCSLLSVFCFCFCFGLFFNVGITYYKRQKRYQQKNKYFFSI